MNNSIIQVMNETSKGHPLQIIYPKENSRYFELDEQVLEDLLGQNHIKDKHIAIVSVAGAFRKGKSFLLDFFIRYLSAKGLPDWLGSDNEPLKGFSWKGGCERDTTGILAWSEIFLVPTSDGEEVGVLLLDTQGAFDSQSTVRECATVFALTTMVSSVQVYNLSQNIQEDDLQHLQLFTEYGRLALEDSGDVPFQKLQFLVRDWSFPYDAPYGMIGGQTILDRRLQITEQQPAELQSLRKHIRSCFTDISCFLMPHPGLKVATNPNFDGRLCDIEDEFKAQLKILTPLLLAPNNLVRKKVSGRQITAKELIHFFKAYIQIYQGEELPEPKSMLLATAEANNWAALEIARDTYSTLMENICGPECSYISSALLEAENLKAKEKALDVFKKTKKMGGDDFSIVYVNRLEEALEETYNKYKSSNETKNIFKVARTPSVYFTTALIFYILSGIFSVLGFALLNTLCTVFMGLSLISLVLWAYARYSGELREIGYHIDAAADSIWQFVMKPVYAHFIEYTIQKAAHSGSKQTFDFSDSESKLY